MAFAFLPSVFLSPLRVFLHAAEQQAGNENASLFPGRASRYSPLAVPGSERTVFTGMERVGGGSHRCSPEPRQRVPNALRRSRGGLPICSGGRGEGDLRERSVGRGCEPISDAADALEFPRFTARACEGRRVQAGGKGVGSNHDPFRRRRACVVHSAVSPRRKPRGVREGVPFSFAAF